MVRKRAQVRFLDMFSRLAAAVIEPVLFGGSSNSTLNGPKAICLPTRIRRRGRIFPLSTMSKEKER